MMTKCGWKWREFSDGVIGQSRLGSISCTVHVLRCTSTVNGWCNGTDGYFSPGFPLSEVRGQSHTGVTFLYEGVDNSYSLIPLIPTKHDCIIKRCSLALRSSQDGVWTLELYSVSPETTDHCPCPMAMDRS
jgi:hypothetical protein